MPDAYLYLGATWRLSRPLADADLDRAAAWLEARSGIVCVLPDELRPEAFSATWEVEGADIELGLDQAQRTAEEVLRQVGVPGKVVEVLVGTDDDEHSRALG